MRLGHLILFEQEFKKLPCNSSDLTMCKSQPRKGRRGLIRMQLWVGLWSESERERLRASKQLVFTLQTEVYEIRRFIQTSLWGSTSCNKESTMSRSDHIRSLPRGWQPGRYHVTKTAALPPHGRQRVRGRSSLVAARSEGAGGWPSRWRPCHSFFFFSAPEQLLLSRELIFSVLQNLANFLSHPFSFILQPLCLG